jgi:hypothetical protein
MPEKAVTDELQANGFSESSLEPGERSFYNRIEEHTCNVEFDKHVLVYAERFWSPPSNNAEDAIETFIDAVQSVTRKSAIEHCEVFSYETTDPDRRYRYVGTKCNGHNIGITLRHDFKTKTSNFDIDEEVGMRSVERKAMLRRPSSK